NSKSFPSGFVSVRLDGAGVRFQQAHAAFGHLTASPDGRRIFTASAGLRDPSGRRLTPSGTIKDDEGPVSYTEPVSYIGSPSSDDYLEVRGLPQSEMIGMPPRRTEQAVSVVVHRADGFEMLTIPDVPGMGASAQWQVSRDGDFTNDKRFQLIPQ